MQRERVEALAASQGHTVVAWFEDLDQSGGKWERPGFQTGLGMVEAGEADGVAVARLDRFARSVADAGRALRMLEQAGGFLVAGDLGMDTSTPAGKLMRNVLMALAEFELDRVREQTSDARDRTIARGVHISRVAPFGYRREKASRLEPDPVTAPVVRELFHRRAAGQSWRALCGWLDQRYPRDLGWTHGTLGTIVGNRVYLGEARSGSRLNKGAHEPLVTRAEWEAAQSAGKRTPSRDSGALLAGIVRCAACGYTMTRMGDGRRGYANYHCRIRHGGGVCPAPSAISVRRADGYVVERLLTWAATQGAASEPAAPTRAVEDAVAAVELAEAELAAYRDASVVTVIGQDAFLAGLAERAARVDEARRALRDASSISAVGVGAADFLNDWDEMTTAERHGILAAVIDVVAVRRAGLGGKGTPAADRILILWRGEGPSELPGRGRAGLRPIAFPDE